MKGIYKNKKVLITGGLGLIGSNLAHRLVDLNADVLIVDSLLPLYGANKFNLKDIKSKVKINIADIRDEVAMNQLVQDRDYIFNFAAQVSHNDSLKDPFLDLDINCKGHLTVLEACKNFNPDAKIFFSGSRMQFGEIEYLPVDEKHPLRPKSIYGVHKTAGEEYYLYYNREEGLNTVMFRIANPYGPRSQMKHHKYSMVNWFLRQAMDDKTINIFGDGKQIRDYIYIDDLTEAILKSMASDKTDGEIFNVGSGVGTEFGDMVETIIKTVGYGRVKHVPWPEDYHSIETGDYVTDITKISKTLNWIPKVDLKEGIKRTFEYYKKNRRHYW